MMPPPKPQGPPPPIPPQSASPKNIKVNTKTANVGLTGDNQSPASPNKKNWRKIIIIAAIVFLSLGAIAGAFFLLQERQDIRKGATSSGKLICMPLDDNGNITNDKYHHDRMLIKNETDQDIQIKIQQNLCPYQEQNLELGPGYRCDDFVSANPYIVRAGTQVIIPSPDTASWLPADWIPCQKVGQLDVQKDKDHYQHIGVDPNTIPDCFNTVDNRVWEGGVAFTIKANKAPCSESGCPDVSLDVKPATPREPILVGKPIIITASSPEPLVCTEISQYNGLKESPKNPQTRGQYTWTWDAMAGDTTGKYSLTFRGNTQDSGQGECPERAIGEWCQIDKDFTIYAPSTRIPLVCEYKNAYRNDDRNEPGHYYLTEENRIKNDETVKRGEIFVFRAYTKYYDIRNPINYNFVDVLPESLIFLDANVPECNYNDATRTVTCQTSNHSDAGAFRVKVADDASGTITNTATLRAEDGTESTCSATLTVASPTTIITQPEYSCNCHTVKVYDQNKNLLAREQLENLKAGDLIYIGVVANNGYPNYPVSKARIRVNRNYWLEQDETEEKINYDYPDHLTEFIRPYTIPEGVLNFKIEAEIYLDGPSGVGGWF